MIGNPYKGKSFKGLVQYLFHGRKDDPNPHRVEWHVTRNLPTDDPDALPAILRAHADQNVSVKKPVYHLPLSWPPDEQLDRNTQIAVAEQLLSDLGLSEHQCLIVAHNDGECPHIHLVINTVHPETGRVWNAWRDVYRIMESLQRQERERGLRIVERPDLEEWRSGRRDPERKRAASREERLRAAREGDTPLIQWIERDMRDVRNAITRHFRDARSWTDLESRLRKHGLELRQAGQGFRITDGKYFMTLSRVGKHARWEVLEQRFGRTWADHLATRSLTISEQAGIEPLKALAIMRGSARPVSNRRVTAMIDAWLAHRAYEHFRQEERSARDEAVRLLRLQRELRANRLAQTALVGRRDLAQVAYANLMTSVYRNPATAMTRLRTAIRAGAEWSDIDFHTIGKVRGLAVAQLVSKERRQAQANMKRIRAVFLKEERLAAKLDVLAIQQQSLLSRLGAQERAFDVLKASMGTHAERAALRKKLYRKRAEALRGIDTRDITRSNLHEDSKRALRDAIVGQRLEKHTPRRGRSLTRPR